MKYFTINTPRASLLLKNFPESSNEIQKIKYIMRIGFISLALLLTSFQLLLALPVKSQKISSVTVRMELKNETLLSAFKKIEKQTSFRFVYRKGELKTLPSKNISSSIYTVEQVLKMLLEDTDLSFKQVDNNLLILAIDTQTAGSVNLNESKESVADIVIRGQITDTQGETLPGVSIKLKGTDVGTTTDINGNYSINVPDKNSILVFTYVGFVTREIAVSDDVTINVKFEAANTALNEVVVTALGIKREKRNLTYSTQEVKGSELLIAKEAGVLNALAGKVSGAQITSSSGAPGSSTRIVIRGATSVLGDNQALIVVDGVPVNNAETGAVSRGAGSSRSIDIDPTTIENVNVLKGAAATALYGSAGARGVVIITTKGGSINKKPVLSFSSEASLENGIFPELQDKYAQGLNGVYANGENQKQSAAWGPLMDTLKINGQPAPKYNPIDLFFQTGHTTNHSVSLNGGNTNSGYFMSYSYFDQEGIIPTTNFKRHSFFAKYNSKITEKLSSSFQLSFSNSGQQRTPEGVDFSNPGLNPIFVIYNQPISWNPYPVFNAGGTQRIFRTGRNNPYWSLENIYNKYNVNRFIPVVSLNYQLNKWLTISERLGADIYTEMDNFKEAPSATLRTPGKLISNNSNFRQFNSDLIISANKQLGDYNLNVLLGNNIYSSYSQRNNIQGVGLAVNDFDNISSAATITASDRSFLQRKVGFYGQANIDYKDFLVLSVTGRYDGSSVLSTDNAFYPYGSVAGSFIFSELLPAKFASIIPYGKLRISYATVGNDNVGVYSLGTPYRSATINNIQFPYQGQGGFLLSSTLGNPNLMNERLNEVEVGLETRLFKDRIGIEASYFNRKSVDGIIPGVSISAATGYTGTTVNSAEISTKGFEFLANATPVKSQNFTWNTAVSFSRMRNKVESLYGELSQLGRIVVGQPYNVFYGSRFKRSTTGEVYVAANGLPIFDTTPGIIGDANPDWLAGITNNFNYKQLSLGFFFDVKEGGDILNQTELNNGFFGTSKITEDRNTPIIYNGVSVVDNKPNTVQVSAQNLYRFYSDYDEPAIQDASYVKLRNISLSYNFSKELLKRTPIQAATITITGRNLWIHAPNFTSGDPEASTYGTSNENQGLYGGAYPSTKSYNLSLKVDF